MLERGSVERQIVSQMMRLNTLFQLLAEFDSVSLLRALKDEQNEATQLVARLDATAELERVVGALQTAKESFPPIDEQRMLSAKIAISLQEGDHLIDVVIVSPKDDLILSTANGMAIRFSEEDARAMGRSTSGVRGIDVLVDVDGGLLGPVPTPTRARVMQGLLSSLYSVGPTGFWDSFTLVSEFGYVHVHDVDPACGPTSCSTS